MRYLCLKSLERMLKDSRLFEAGRHSALRDEMLMRAQLENRPHVKAVHVREARRFHHLYLRDIRRAA